jgi:hypothetical protein
VSIEIMQRSGTALTSTDDHDIVRVVHDLAWRF